MIKISTPVWTAVAAAMLAMGAANAQTAPAAQQAPGASTAQTHARHADRAQKREHMQQKRQQHREQRAQKLKQRLQLTDAQLPAWETFQQAMQPKRHARLDRANLRGLSTPERIDRMRAQRQQEAARLDQRGEAVKTFYAQLNAEQQKVFDKQGMRAWQDGKRKHQKRHHRGHADKADSAS